MRYGLWLFSWFLLLLAVIAMAGCVSAPVAVKLPEKSCPRLSLPSIPQHVLLQIDGDKVTVDPGGDVILRGYVQARRALR